MPSDYVPKILFRQHDYKDIRKELFKIGQDTLMEYNQKAVDLMFA
jgi:hypothetical protein